MPDTKTRAQQNKAIRQEALRQQLQAQGHVQYVVENIKKLEDAASDPEAELNVPAIKAATETRLKLIDKYLPSLKQVEYTDTDPLDGITDDELEARIKEFLS